MRGDLRLVADSLDVSRRTTSKIKQVSGVSAKMIRHYDERPDCPIIDNLAAGGRAPT